MKFIVCNVISDTPGTERDRVSNRRSAGENDNQQDSPNEGIIS